MGSRKEGSQKHVAKFYNAHARELNRELVQSIPKERLKALHHKQAWRHFLIAGRQLALYIGLPLLIWYVPSPWVWVPASILLGFVILGFQILVHEATHGAIFQKKRPKLTRFLGSFYGMLCGLSFPQFHRWHTDHHNELGSKVDDPKRAHLSPKRNRRWYKLLYCTPALFPIYFRAAAIAGKRYSPELRRQIAFQRRIAILFHLGILAWFLWLSPIFAVKAYIIPVFFVFPVVFTINRLGQHYMIDPDKIANWSTLIRPNAAWNFLFLYSSYHLEHHYFQGVPFYNLKPLQKALDPFFEKHDIPSYTYRQLLWGWFVKNHTPHTNWERETFA